MSHHSRNFVLPAFAMSLLILACTCSLTDGLQPAPSGAGSEPGNSDSARATLNPDPETMLDPTSPPAPTQPPPTQAHPAGPAFQDAHFSAAITDDLAPVDLRTDFPVQTTEVYAIASWTGMRDGMLVHFDWYRDGEIDTSSDYEWTFGAQGSDIAINYIYNEAGQPLPKGSYYWEMSLEGETMVSGRFSIGEQAVVLLKDDFGDPSSGWEVGDYQGGSVGYVDGAYQVRATMENEMMWGLAFDVFQNVDIQVEATQVLAPANNNNAYGVMCRVREGGVGYSLRISGDGFYSIQVMDQAGSARDLVGWQPSDAIRKGNATNQIRAVCDADHFALYANGVLLAEAWDDSIMTGDIALMTISYEPDPSVVLFDNLLVTSP